MIRRRCRHRLALLVAAAAVFLGGSCGGGAEPARVTVRNDFANAQFTLVEVAYQGHHWTSPVGRGEQSEPAEVPAGLDFAYALAVWAYDPGASPAQTPLLIRTKEKVESIAGVSSDVVFSESTHTGKCGGLSQAVYEAAVSAQFPSATVQPYDAIACP